MRVVLAISADTALRLARFFGNSEQFWLNLQARHYLEVERDRLGVRLKAEVEVFAVAMHKPSLDRSGVWRPDGFRFRTPLPIFSA